jgi:hypothetical protein
MDLGEAYLKAQQTRTDAQAATAQAKTRCDLVVALTLKGKTAVEIADFLKVCFASPQPFFAMCMFCLCSCSMNSINFLCFVCVHVYTISINLFVITPFTTTQTKHHSQPSTSFNHLSRTAF